MNKELQLTILAIIIIIIVINWSYAGCGARLKIWQKHLDRNFNLYCWYKKWHFLALEVGFGVSCMVVPFSKPLCRVSSFCLLQKTNQSAYLKIQRERRRLFLQIEIIRGIVAFWTAEWVGSGGLRVEVCVWVCLSICVIEWVRESLSWPWGTPTDVYL